MENASENNESEEQQMSENADQEFVEPRNEVDHYSEDQDSNSRFEAEPANEEPEQPNYEPEESSDSRFELEANYSPRNEQQLSQEPASPFGSDSQQDSDSRFNCTESSRQADSPCDSESQHFESRPDTEDYSARQGQIGFENDPEEFSNHQTEEPVVTHQEEASPRQIETHSEHSATFSSEQTFRDDSEPIFEKEEDSGPIFEKEDSEPVFEKENSFDESVQPDFQVNDDQSSEAVMPVMSHNEEEEVLPVASHQEEAMPMASHENEEVMPVTSHEEDELATGHDEPVEETE